jgi:hypothetical protein
MLYHLLVSLSDQFSALNVFRYLTFRTGGAIMTALLFVFMFGPGLISMLRLKQGRGQPIRSDGPQRHVLEKHQIAQMRLERRQPGQRVVARIDQGQRQQIGTGFADAQRVVNGRAARLHGARPIGPAIQRSMRA